MFQDIDLRELAEHEGPERAFLTLYLPDEAAAHAIARHAEEARSLVDGHPEEVEHLERNLELAREIVAKHDFGKGALAVFACWACDVARGYPLADAQVAEAFRVGPCFFLRPLAELQDENERFAAVTADHSGAEIWLASMPAAERVDRVAAEIKNHVKKGGWSQKRYQRRRREQVHEFVDEVVEHLGRLREETGFERLVLLGAHDVIARLEEALPPALSEILVGSRQVNADEGDRAVTGAGAEIAQEAEREEERELWRRIQDDALGQGLAATGPARVLAALLEGRVDSVLVDRGLDRRAMRCRECDRIAVGDPDSCPDCGAADPIADDLTNQLVERAELTGARVDFVDGFEELDKVGGVAALLRY